MTTQNWQPPAADHEPHKVIILRGERIDAKRGGRIVPYKIYYPVNHSMTDLPVVLWSHGLGGGREGAAFLVRYLASHGYVVVNVQHPGTDTSLWEGKPGHPWDNIRAAHISRKTTLARFCDIPFILDELPAIAAENPDLQAHIDLSRIGMSGHSFGAITAQIMAGQRLGTGRRRYQLREPRIRAAIAYSPSPAYNHREDPVTIYDGIDIPILCMTGTDDSSPVSGRPYTYRLPIYEHAGSAEKMLLVLQDGDHMVFAGSRGGLGENPKRKEHEALIKILSLAYWDAYLKDDENALKWLKNGGFQGFLGEGGTFDFRGA